MVIEEVQSAMSEKYHQIMKTQANVSLCYISIAAQNLSPSLTVIQNTNFSLNLADIWRENFYLSKSPETGDKISLTKKQ